MSYLQKLQQNVNQIDAKPDVLSRYIGGSNRQNIPYVNGYWQFIVKCPEKLYGSHTDKMEQWFLSTAEGFTPHSRNLNKGDVPGQGGVASSFPTGQTINRTFTVTFREYKNMQMLKMINIWSGIMDPFNGVSELKAKEWIPSSFKGSAYAVLTKPTGAYTDSLTKDDIEEVFAYDGVWVETSPYDAFNQDIAANDFVQLSTTFSFDGHPLTSANDGVLDTIVTLLASLAPNGYNATMDSVRGGYADL